MSTETSHWITTRYRNLLREINIRQPRFILEFGTWKGRTAAKMIKTALKFRKDVFYFGIDLFENLTPDKKKYEHNGKAYCTKKETEKFLKDQGLDKHFFVVRGESKAAFLRIKDWFLPKVDKNAKFFDFIFIDGGHSLETILNDWMAAESVMNDETVVIFDDYYENRDDIGARAIVEFSIPHEYFVVEKLNPIDHQKFPDGSPQPTQMVKVTRRLKRVIQNRGMDEQLHSYPSDEL